MTENLPLKHESSSPHDSGWVQAKQSKNETWLNLKRYTYVLTHFFKNSFYTFGPKPTDNERKAEPIAGLQSQLASELQLSFGLCQSANPPYPPPLVPPQPCPLTKCHITLCVSPNISVRARCAEKVGQSWDWRNDWGGAILFSLRLARLDPARVRQSSAEGQTGFSGSMILTGAGGMHYSLIDSTFFFSYMIRPSKVSVDGTSGLWEQRVHSPERLLITPWLLRPLSSLPLPLPNVRGQQWGARERR